MKLILAILSISVILMGSFFQADSHAYVYLIGAEAGYYSPSGSDSDYVTLRDGDKQTDREIQMSNGADSAYAYARSSLLSGSIGIELEATGSAQATARGTLAETLILDWDDNLTDPFYVWVYWDVYGTYNAESNQKMYTALNAAWGGVDAMRIPQNNIEDWDLTDGEAHMSKRLTIDPTQSVVTGQIYNFETHYWDTIYYDPHEIGIWATLEIRDLKDGYARFGHTGTFNLGFSTDAAGNDLIDIDYTSGSGAFLTEPETTVPIPAGIILLGSGLVGVLGIRRWQN